MPSGPPRLDVGQLAQSAIFIALNGKANWLNAAGLVVYALSGVNAAAEVAKLTAAPTFERNA
jgi:hypothetical protein